MKLWFLKRGYPENIINREMEKVKFKKQVFSRKGGVTKGVSLVITYHPLLKSLGTILYKHSYLLHMDKEAKKVFPVAPIVTLKSAQKLSSYLVRAKLSLQRTVGSFQCNKPRYEVCINVTETDTFTCTVTGESFKINNEFNCDDRCLIYLLTCNQRRKQYVGQTVDSFRFRRNNYKCNCYKQAKGESVKQRHLYDQFMLEGHTQFVNDISIIFIDKTDPIDPLKREQYWRHTLKTLVLYGLNVSESV